MFKSKKNGCNVDQERWKIKKSWNAICKNKG
jgi:hypothetical protein